MITRNDVHERIVKTLEFFVILLKLVAEDVLLALDHEEVEYFGVPTRKDTHEDHIVLLLKILNLFDILAIWRGYEELGLGRRTLVSIAYKHYLFEALNFKVEEVLQVDLTAIRAVLVWGYVLLLNASTLLNGDQSTVIFSILIQDTVRYKEILVLLLFPDHGPSRFKNHLTLIGVKLHNLVITSD